MSPSRSSSMATLPFGVKTSVPGAKELLPHIGQVVGGIGAIASITQSLTFYGVVSGPEAEVNGGVRCFGRLENVDLTNEIRSLEGRMGAATPPFSGLRLVF
ncbi:MAG: hypothetical protein ABJP90_12475 [Paracoccaceae bacterium]